MAMLTLRVLVITLLFACIACECPESDVLSPYCLCDRTYSELSCIGSSSNKLDANRLESIMLVLSNTLAKNKKHFSQLSVVGSQVTKLTANFFKDLTFDDIFLLDNKNLTEINKYAFNGTNLVTKRIRLQGNTRLSQVSDALGQLVNLEHLGIYQGNNVTQVPPYFLKPLDGHESKLETLEFWRTVERVSTRSFYHLNALKRLTFLRTNLSYVPKYAFEFERNSSEKLEILFTMNEKLTGYSFQDDALSSMKRPSFVDLSSNNVTFLNQKAFETFVNENTINYILPLLVDSLDCKDERNDWLKVVKYMNRLHLC